MGLSEELSRILWSEMNFPSVRSHQAAAGFPLGEGLPYIYMYIKTLLGSSPEVLSAHLP